MLMAVNEPYARTVSVTVQASKLTGRVLKAAIAAVIQKMEQERNTPKSRPQQYEAADGQGPARIP